MYLKLFSLPLSWRLIHVGIFFGLQTFFCHVLVGHTSIMNVLGDLTPVASICSWERYGLPASSKGGTMCVCIYEEFTFTYLRYCTLSPNDICCLCWSVLKEETRFFIFDNFPQVKKSEETRIVLDCDFDKIETILQQVKPAYHFPLVQLKCHSEKFQTSLHSMHPFPSRRTKLTC